MISLLSIAKSRDIAEQKRAEWDLLEYLPLKFEDSGDHQS